MMGYFYPLLLYAGLVGGLLLLGITSFTQLRPLHKPVAALWLTVLLCLWLLTPQTGRWVFSSWSPTAMLDGLILIDVNPIIWWVSLTLIGLACGATWIEFSERRMTSPLTGPLLIVSLLLVATSLASGSLLTTLGTWSVFDLVWSAVALIAGTRGERVTFGLATHGIASIILWSVSLLLLREGCSGLWWLMWSSPPLFNLLIIAALMRIGFYPFHITFPRTLGQTRSLSLAYLLSPLLGIGLLYRLMTLPGVNGTLPTWVVGWGIFSLFWNALMAWMGQPQHLTLRAWHGVLLLIVAAASALGTPSLLLWGTAIWFACVMLIALSRGYAVYARLWGWASWIATFFLLGVAPSPLGSLMWGLFETITWNERAFLLIGLSLIGSILLEQNARRTTFVPIPPWAWQRVFFAAGQLLILAILLLTTWRFNAFKFSWLGWVLWCIAMVGAMGATRMRATHGRAWLKPWRERLHPFLQFLDLQWLYRSIWRGAENLLGFLRISAEVVEGSGAMLWSLLILLLVLLVITNQ